jgi:hypothetical protein
MASQQIGALRCLKCVRFWLAPADCDIAAKSAAFSTPTVTGTSSARRRLTHFGSRVGSNGSAAGAKGQTFARQQFPSSGLQIAVPAFQLHLCQEDIGCMANGSFSEADKSSRKTISVSSRKSVKSIF